MFRIPKQSCKLLSIALITLMLVTNPAFIVSVNAAASDDSKEQTTITLDKSSDEMKKDFSAEPVEESAHVTNNEKFTQFANNMIAYYLKGGKRQGPEWLKTTDLNFSFTEDHKPIYSFETIQPFSQANQDGQLWFWQGRYAYQSDNATGNLGVGWRKLSPDKSELFGLNTFYDYGFKYHLARIGLGTEYFNKLMEYRANYYIPVSGDKELSVTYLTDEIQYTYIRAVEGFDYEVGSSFTNAPWLGLYASGFYYNNKYNDDEKGYKFRSKIQITPRFSLDVGYEHSNLMNGSLYGKFMYQLADHLGPALYGGSKEQNNKSIDLSYKLLQKVERNNTIKTETFTKTVATGNLKVTVNNVNSGTVPLAGVRLQAYQNGNEVGNTAVTDSSGVGFISNLPVGDCEVKATYFSVTGTSHVTITKGTQATTTISLNTATGNITVNVYNSNGAIVSGATVTAHGSSGQSAKAEGTIFDRIFGVKTVFAATPDYTFTATTDSQGQAHFTNLPPGRYTFTVESNSQTMQSMPVTIADSGGDKQVEVVLPSSGTPSTNVGSAAITVNDGTTVLTGATVSVVVNGTTETAITNAAGIAAFTNLPVGNYTFTVSMNNYTSNTGTVSVTSGVTAAKTISLTSQGGSVNVTLSGTMAAANYTVTVTDSGGGTHAGTVSKTSTMATISNIPAGICTVAVTAPSGYTTTITPSSFTMAASGSQAVAVSSASQGSGSVNVTLSGADVSASEYTVIVTDSTGATHTGGVRSGSATATISSIPAGSCTVAVTAPSGYTATVSPSSFTLTVGGSQAVAVASSLGTGSVNVTLSGAMAVADYTVIVTDNASGQHIGIVNSGSTTTTISNVPIGNCTVTVTSPSGYSTNVTPGSFTLAASGSQAVSVVSSSVGSGSVNVTLSGAMATSDYTVTVTDSAGAAHTGTVKSGSTTATISSIPAGSCTVAVTAPNGYTTAITPSSFTLAASGSQAVSVVSSSLGSGTIHVVLSGSGSDVSASNYTVTVTDSAGVSTHTGTVNSSTTTADITIPAGSYSVAVTSPTGFTTIQTPASGTMTAGDIQMVTVTSSIQTFTITASASSGGSISPSGSTSVAYGSNSTFIITADSTHKISGIFIDGSSTSQTITATGAGGSQTYTFPSVTTAGHTISATFTAAVTGITVILDDTNSGQGSAMLWNGMSVANVPVEARLNNYQGTLVATVYTDSTGKAVFNGLASGVYVFCFETDYPPMYSNDVNVVAGVAQTITIPTGGY